MCVSVFKNGLSQNLYGNIVFKTEIWYTKFNHIGDKYLSINTKYVQYEWVEKGG